VFVTITTLSLPSHLFNMNLYFTRVGRPPFNKVTTFCILSLEAKHAANVFHLTIVNGKVSYPTSPPSLKRLPDKELHSLVGSPFDKWKASLNAVEIPATLFKERFGLSY
jgi:hypothetical protein